VAQSYQDLRKLSKEEVIELYNRTAPNVQLGLAFFRDELAHREVDEQNQRLIKMTRGIWVMTFVITLATILNVVLFALSVRS
jgi:hypothetical protein